MVNMAGRKEMNLGAGPLDSRIGQCYVTQKIYVSGLRR